MVAIAASCRPGRSAAELATAARRALELSKYGDALELARQARARGPAKGVEAERLRLLEAEALIFGQREKDGLALLEAPLDAEALAALSARRDLLTGTALRRTGHWPEAKEKLAAALDAAGLAADRGTEAMAALQLASGLNGRRQWSEASRYLLRAAAAAAELEDPYLVAIVRFNQALDLMRRGEADRSTEIYRAVANWAETAGDQVMRARALDNMGINYQNVGDYERALEYNARALEALERADLPDTRMQTHGTRGRLLLDLDRAEEAVPELERALSLARRRSNPEQIHRWSNNLAEALLLLGRVDEAERLTNEALSTEPRSSYALATRGSIHERRGRPAEALRDWTTVLADPDCPRTLRWEALFGLARLHRAAGDRAAADQRYREALALIDQARASLRTDDSRLTFLTLARGVYRGYVDALENWGDDEAALRVEESSRARFLGDATGARPPTGTLSGSLSQLAARTGTVFLSYWIADSGSSHVRVIGPGSAHRLLLKDATSREVSRLVREHNDLVEGRLEDPREKGVAATRLYDMLVRPVAAYLPRDAHVVLIPDAALHRLNFETLVREREGRKGFWIEDVTIQVAPSLSLLKEQTTRGASPKHLLLIGDALPAPDFGRLDHAAEEMKAVRETFGAGSVTELAGADARPSAFAGAASASHTHIHFTAHAKADPESPLDSAVILSPEPFAGGEPRYRLLAREVASLRLNADLVTVSACRSAGDRAVAGEGMVGFAWAFLRAGAGYVVAGLWDVNDRSTVRLMAEMYAGIHAGKPAPEALRAAKLSLIAGGRSYAKPYYWAPFQVYSRSLAKTRPSVLLARRGETLSPWQSRYGNHSSRHDGGTEGFQKLPLTMPKR